MNLYSESAASYCERIGTGIFSEPINLFTNVFLLVASFFSLKLLQKHNLLKKKYVSLAILVGLIGIGSGLWHSFRNPITHAMDFIPIYAFFIVYLYSLFLLLTKKKMSSLGITIAYVFAQVWLSAYLPQLLNGSIRHVFNLGLIIGVLLWLRTRYQKLNYPLLALFLTYGLGVFFRSIDKAVCESFPVGTHFVWHIAAAITCFYAVKSLVWIEENTDTTKTKTIL